MDTKAILVSVFKQQITDSIRSQFDRLAKIYGLSMRGVANSKSYRVWSETVRPCCTLQGNYRVGSEYALNEQSLDKFSDKLANEMADELMLKIQTKVGQLENPNVVYVSGANFVITGTKAGKHVRMEQNQIINVSVKGKLFNQFPSRIYVDNKFTPASKFEAMQ